MEIGDKVLLFAILIGSHVIIYMKGLSHGYKRAYKEMTRRH